MTNYEILGLLQNTRYSLNGLNGFIEQLRAVAYNRDQLLDLFTEVASFDNKQPALLGQLHQELNRVVGEITKLSSRQFFECPFELTTILKDFLVGVNKAHVITNKVLHELNVLQDFYDSFTRHHSTDRAVKVVLQAHNFIETFDKFYESTEFVSGLLYSDQTPPKESGTLDLYMPSDLTFEEFICRLESVNIIYHELAQIMNVSTSDEPLQILKVESGSLWTWLFGNSRVLKLMDDFIRSAAGYMHRTYTNEGKRETLPTSLKAMNEILIFATRLEQEGVNVGEIKDQLAKGTVLIAKELNALLQNQASVTINGESIQLEESGSRRQLESRRTQRLQDHSQET